MSPQMLKERHQFHLDYGITDPDERAKLEVAISLGFKVNAAAGTTLWDVYNVFSRPELVRKIRDEIPASALVSHGVLSADKLRLSCPRLNLACKETLRLYVPSASARLVHEDVLVADQWLLRKGSIV